MFITVFAKTINWFLAWDKLLINNNNNNNSIQFNALNNNNNNKSTEFVDNGKKQRMQLNVLNNGTVWLKEWPCKYVSTTGDVPLTKRVQVLIYLSQHNRRQDGQLGLQGVFHGLL